MFELGIFDKQKKYLVVELIYFDNKCFLKLRKIYLDTALPVKN